MGRSKRNPRERSDFGGIRPGEWLDDCCPVCGCRKIRIIGSEVMQWPLEVLSGDSKATVDTPMLTYDLADGVIEPRILPAVCNNPRCGIDKDGVAHPTAFWFSANFGEGPRVRLRKEGQMLTGWESTERIVRPPDADFFDEPMGRRV